MNSSVLSEILQAAGEFKRTSGSEPDSIAIGPDTAKRVIAERGVLTKAAFERFVAMWTERKNPGLRLFGMVVEFKEDDGFTVSKS
jgi:hypothetical protein